MVDPKRLRMRGIVRADRPYSAFTSEIRADLEGHGVSPGLARELVKREAKALRQSYRRGDPAEALGLPLFLEACRMADEGDPLVSFHEAVPPKVTN